MKITVEYRVMQLGFVSAILPELSLDEVCQVAQAEGYDCVVGR